MCEKPLESVSLRKKRSPSRDGSEWSSAHPVPLRPRRQTEETSESEAELATRSYGSVLRYQCGLARKFYDPEMDEFYPERNMTCNWNATWTTRDYIDECGKQIRFITNSKIRIIFICSLDPVSLPS